MKRFIPTLAGLLFALGLGLGGMTQPAKVLGFLDVFGPWDPSLAFVMGGGLLVHLPFVQALRRRDPSRNLGPRRAPIDARLIVGAALFGVGWGIAGLCPGPALVALAGGRAALLAFVLPMLVTLALTRRLPSPI